MRLARTIEDRTDRRSLVFDCRRCGLSYTDAGSSDGERRH
jgi:hypothetical protein